MLLPVEYIELWILDMAGNLEIIIGAEDSVENSLHKSSASSPKSMLSI